MAAPSQAPGRGRDAAAGAGLEPVRALTDEQEQAIARRRGPLLLAAGAGSGKTSVLVERFVRAVLEDGIAPGRILAITFTDRAAGELRERVRERFLELSEREAARDTEAAFVSTFHGFCARLLRAHPLMAGLDPEFTILEEHLVGRLRELAFSAALGDFLAGERPEAVDLLAAYGADRVRAMVEGVYGELRSRGLQQPRLPASELQLAMYYERPPDGDARPADAEGVRTSVLLDELLQRFGGSYGALKRRRRAVDFDDLELRARALLQEQETVRTAWSERFELLMVDEFQDTNPRQLAILAALERGNLFTVGDELQSIYGFRHADVRLFRARRAELAASGASLELVRNFRSRAPLIDVVNAVFTRRLGAGYTPLVVGREDGGDAGEADAGEPLVELLLTSRRDWEDDRESPQQAALGAPRWRQAEARMLAERVAELVQSGRAGAGEVVVLLRALGDLEVYERALVERGLRTLAVVGGFWGQQQVGDLLAYLRALANPLDELALYETLASPLVGLSSDGLALLARAARPRGRGQVWATVQGALEQLAVRLPARDHAALAEFRERFEYERRTAPLRPIAQLIERAVEQSGYRAHLLALDWGARRLANVHKLLRLARRFEASEGRDLRGFLDFVAHQLEATKGGEPDAPVAGAEPDAVRLMSIHAAKGLEFPVVCVADLGRAQNMSVPDLLVDGDRVGLRLVGLDGGDATPSLDFERLCEERMQAQAAEEDRLLYVAMTRARERLLLSGAVDFGRWPEPRPRAPAISWLGPALSPDLPRIVAGLATAERPVFDLAVGGGGEGRVRCRVNTPQSRTPEPIVQAGGRAPEASAALTGPPASGRGRDISGARAAHVRGESANGPAGDAGPLDLLGSISYTTLSELERCGYRYYLERVLGLAEDRSPALRAFPAREGLRAAERGTLLHRLLESVDFRRPSPPSPEAVERTARELGQHVGRGEREQLAGLLGAACGSPLAARLAASLSLRREHPFAFSLGAGEPLVTGVIDLLASEADRGLLVLDYKSDRVGAGEDLRALVESDYGVQRLLYALAVLRGGAARVEVVHWFLERPQEPIGAQFTAADRGDLEERLGERLRRAREHAFSVSRRPYRGLCETCPGRAGMCSWGDEETLREIPQP
ncbi:MAG: UvrD-helicase domain-containing protein [Solirubrobacteraceae bacterium]|jgi:ATP-dependent exoDNAse (exonuclease V) beta subunit